MLSSSICLTTSVVDRISQRAGVRLSAIYLDVKSFTPVYRLFMSHSTVQTRTTAIWCGVSYNYSEFTLMDCVLTRRV